MLKRHKKSQRYIVTTVQYGAVVNKGLLDNMLVFAKEHKVEQLLTFVQNGRYKDEEEIDKRIFHAGIETVDKMTINSNLRLQDM